MQRYSDVYIFFLRFIPIVELFLEESRRGFKDVRDYIV